MSKYKFRLSYMKNNNLIPIELEKIDGSEDYNMTKIKSIDYFTTSFADLNELLLYLKFKMLIPNDVKKLYITYDKKINDKIIQEIYAYGEKLFYKKDIEKLKWEYSYKLVKDKRMYGKFIMYIIEHYRRKYKNKTFADLYNIARTISEYGYNILTPSEANTYREEINNFLDFIFYKKTKKGKEIDYKNIRDFICFLSGEKIIINKYSEKVNNSDSLCEDIVIDKNNENVLTYNEYKKHNELFIAHLHENDFDPYVDGYDFISSNKEEIEDSLNEYSKKLCFKRDNGEYE